jgi:histone H3/H4
MKIEQTTSSVIEQLWGLVGPGVKESKCLEDAAQSLATQLHTQFGESVVIARVFFTVPYDALPPKNKEFVSKLAESAQAASELRATTPVLSLIGTHGQEENWCDRRQSKGHVGIPLISSSFVDSIPMISRLLKELGVPVEWVDSHDAEIIIETVGRSAGLFFVENAAEATDRQGRKIIAAQDFVSDYGVKSVLGIGGAYPSGEMIVVVAFCRETFPRTIAEHFLPLTDLFKSETASLVGGKRIFSEA